jgi:hypothetical protein
MTHTTPDHIDSETFRLRAHDKIDLCKRAARIEPNCASEPDYEALLQKHVAKLRAL